MALDGNGHTLAEMCRPKRGTMESCDATEDRAGAVAGPSETALAAARQRKRRLLFIGAPAGLAILGCLFAILARPLWRTDNAQPDLGGWSEQNRRMDGSGRSVPGQAFGPRAEISALRKEALEVADRLVGEFPDAPDAVCAKGLVHHRYGNRAQAVKCWERCLRLDSGFAGGYYCLGRDALDRADYEESARLLRKAVEIDPEMAEAHLLLAKAMLCLGRMEDAVAALEEHLRVSPRSTEGLFRLGQACLYVENYNRAAQYHKAAIETNPAYAPAYYGLATACERLGQKQEAGECRETFRKLKARDRSIAAGRRRRYDDPASSRRSLADAYRTAAKVCYKHGSVQRAAEHWQKAATLSPKDTQSRKGLVSVYEQQERPEEALEVLKELSEIEPESVIHYINTGVLNMRLRRFDAAEEAFQKVRRLTPERPEGYVALAQLYVQTDRKLSEARTLARKAVELEPVAANYFLLSSACEKNGDDPGALTAIQRAVKLDPGNLRYREAYARIQKNK